MYLQRIYPDECGGFALPRGSYGRDQDGTWWIRPPVASAISATLEEHIVLDHEDGTISLHPSFLDELGEVHGHLIRGEWRSIT